MMAERRIDVRPLVSHRFPINDGELAYELVGGSEPSLGILLAYPGIPPGRASRTVQLPLASGRAARRPTEDSVSLSLIGSGSYATGVLIPAFKDAGAHLHSVASNSGVSGLHAARKYGFSQTTTDTDQLFADESTNAVAIATRHDSHAPLVIQGLKAGKHIFVEKPLCLTMAELAAIESAYIDARSSFARPPMLMVGFNRRYSPHALKMRRLLDGVRDPKAMVMTVNAGKIPADHWTQDRESGGGRILGEACHFVDLMRFLAGAPISQWSRTAMTSQTDDTVTLQLGFEDGSIGTIHYFANGDRGLAKERLEVFCGGRVLQLNNFRSLRGYGWPGFAKMSLWRQDKGQKGCAQSFVDSAAGTSDTIIPLAELVEVSRVCIQLATRQ
jgi:predicted dehydrogenase